MPNLTKAPERAIGAVSVVRDFARDGKPKPKRVRTADEAPEAVVTLLRKGQLPLCVSRARPDRPDQSDQPGHLAAITELISEAKLWLPSKFTDQWSKDWVDQKGQKRSDRVEDSLRHGTTWIVTVTDKNQSYAVATVTIEPTGNPKIWARPGDLDVSAVYLSRLVVARRFADLKIGSAVLNWACDYARRAHRAKWVRIDVWTRNFALHRYYRRQGFRQQGLCPDENYPSRARFQRRTRKRMRRVPDIKG